MVFIILLVILPLVLIFGLLPLIAIIDILRSQFEGNDALLMALLVFFIPLGSILYFIIAPSRKMRNC